MKGAVCYSEDETSHKPVHVRNTCSVHVWSKANPGTALPSVLLFTMICISKDERHGTILQLTIQLKSLAFSLLVADPKGDVKLCQRGGKLKYICSFQN